MRMRVRVYINNERKLSAVPIRPVRAPSFRICFIIPREPPSPMKSVVQPYGNAIKEMLSLIIRVMAHDMPSKSSNPLPGSTVLFHNHCPKSSAPCHRHLACFFTVSHSLRSCSARFGHNLSRSSSFICIYRHNTHQH